MTEVNICEDIVKYCDAEPSLQALTWDSFWR